MDNEAENLRAVSNDTLLGLLTTLRFKEANETDVDVRTMLTHRITDVKDEIRRRNIAWARAKLS